jgi:hypothetical protein
MDDLRLGRFLCKEANKSLDFPISPMGGLQYYQDNFSWMG